MITTIIKRDGRKVPFNVPKIADAVYKAAKAVGGTDSDMALELASKACSVLEAAGNNVPTVEQVQDSVEKTLIESGHSATAKSYILYRADRNKTRDI